DVVTLVHHRAPPRVLDVALELDAERTVVPRRADAAVDLARREDEAAPLAQRDELRHQVVGHRPSSWAATEKRAFLGRCARGRKAGRRLRLFVGGAAAHRLWSPFPTQQGDPTAACRTASA